LIKNVFKNVNANPMLNMGFMPKKTGFVFLKTQTPEARYLCFVIWHA